MCMAAHAWAVPVGSQHMGPSKHTTQKERRQHMSRARVRSKPSHTVQHDPTVAVCTFPAVMLQPLIVSHHWNVDPFPCQRILHQPTLRPTCDAKPSAAAPSPAPLACECHGMDRWSPAEDSPCSQETHESHRCPSRSHSIQHMHGQQLSRQLQQAPERPSRLYPLQTSRKRLCGSRNPLRLTWGCIQN